MRTWYTESVHYKYRLYSLSKVVAKNLLLFMAQNPENEVHVGISQFQGGANGLLNGPSFCSGNPNTFATQANQYAVACILIQNDSTTGYTNIVWQNTGTVAVPAWTAIANQNIILASVVGAILALTQAQGKSLIILDRAAGITITLPAPIVGTYFDFIVLTSVTSNNYKVITSGALIFLLGSLINIDTDSSNAVAAWTADGSTIVACTMNGTTTGGLKGTMFRVTCISATEWAISGIDQGNGTVATPFATS